MAETVHVHLQVDCECMQQSVRDAALGENALRGLEEILAETSCRGVFVAIPKDLEKHAPIYRQLEEAGHEVGLHAHPAEQGYGEFMGASGPGEQRRMLREGMDRFADVMGRPPRVFTPGYGSANDHTFPLLEELGFTHGSVSMPTRDLPACACVWGSAPLDVHFPHRYNRCLVGNVDFVEIPFTLDPESRMWGGRHPQDLRIELVDAKNHYYTIEKAIRRQVAAGEATPVKVVKALTHNVFRYGDRENFRRETLFGVLAAAKKLCMENGCEFQSSTSAEIAALYRKAVPLPEREPELQLDVRGRNNTPSPSSESGENE